MPLTPADIRGVSFSKPSIGKRGYKEDEVDLFLDLVGAELALLIEINKDLRDEIEWLHQCLRTASAGKVLDLAQEMAHRLTHDVEAEADEMLGEARIKPEQLLSNARAKADGIVNEAKARAETILNDACTRAGALDRRSPANAALPQAVHMPVGNGSTDGGLTNKPGASGGRWQPAV